MDFANMTLGELLAVDPSKLSNAQKVDWGMAIEAKQKAATTTPKTYEAIPEAVLKIKAEPTGDPIMDAWNWVRALDGGIRGTGFSDQERAAMADAYAAAMDDYNRLVKERDTASKASTSNPPEPNVSTSAKKIPVLNKATGQYDWIDNPNYVDPAALAAASRAPQAFSSTQAGMDYASSLRIQEHAAELDQQLEADKKRLAWQIETGQITTEQAKQEWQVKLADYQDAKARARAAEEYNRDLPFKNAQEARAQAQEARAQEQARLQGLVQQAGIYKDQAESGQAAVDAGVKLGIAAPDAVLRRAYDPYAMLTQIVNQMRTQGIPTPDSQPVGKPVEVPTVQAPSFTAPSLRPKDELTAPSLG